MNIRLVYLQVRTRQTIEEVHFSESVTFLYGPVGTGKSTIARLVDYCFGGELERTPAIQKEFVSVTLVVKLGKYECTLERGADDTQTVRVSWIHNDEEYGSVNAPLSAGEMPLVDGEVYNLSDLIFYLCGVEPIKVLKRSRDPDSPMIRLSFRDIWWYCYLDQAHLDSSFFRLEDPFRGRKSQDAMRFFTGLHSERLSQIQAELYKAVNEQQGARAAVTQIRNFMARFDLGSEFEISAQIETTEHGLKDAEKRKAVLEAERMTRLHPTDQLRNKLRQISQEVSDLQEAISFSESTLSEQEALKSELITAKIKSERAEHAGEILDGVDYSRCPQCGSDIAHRPKTTGVCGLCHSDTAEVDKRPSVEYEVFRREINDRIDQIADSIGRRRRAQKRSERQLQSAEEIKIQLDRQLQEELARYDSAFVESIREVEREIATLGERCKSLAQLQEMPRAVSELEESAGELQGRIDRLRSKIDEERGRLRTADENARAIAEKFKEIMLNVSFPGVSEEDKIVLDPRNWKPVVVHSEQEWGFWDTGSGGKKTLYNVCYALAIHEVAIERGLTVPNILVVDSPTKNISDHENPELVNALYREIFRLSADSTGGGIQFLLIDSDLVQPEIEVSNFSHRRFAGEPEAPSLISYYDGP